MSDTTDFPIHPAPTGPYISDTDDLLASILSHVAAIHAKVDSLEEFTSGAATAISGAANAGGMQGAMVRSMLPPGMVDSAESYLAEHGQSVPVLDGAPE